MSARAMRDSGVAWIGEIPKHWRAARIIRVARLESGHTPSRQVPEYWKPEECTIPWFTLGDVWQIRDGRQDYLGDTAEKISPLGIANSSARLLPAGTVVLSRTASVGFSGIMPRPMATTQDFANWVCGAQLHPKYLLYVLRSMRQEFALLMQGSTHQTIYVPDLKKLAIPLPPLGEQRRIAAFLDARTAAVDAALAEHETALAKLAEQRQALISHAVTRGLDARVATRDGGVSWIGRVPEHWRVVRIVRVARLESGHTPSRQVPDYWKAEECTIPWFTLGDVWQLRDGLREYLGDTAEKISPAGIANSSARLLPAGTVILSRTASVGFSGIMPRPMATTQDFANWVCGPLLLPEYLLYVLRSMHHEFGRMTQGSTHQTIYMPDLKKLAIPLPPVGEQRMIVAHLRERTTAIDTAADAARRAVALLREYRQSLVTAAVTGRVAPEEPRA